VPWPFWISSSVVAVAALGVLAWMLRERPDVDQPAP